MSKSCEFGGYRYGIDFLYGRRRPVPFLDHYHRGDNAAYSESTRVQHAFKDGNPAAVAFFAPIMARIAAHEFGQQVTHVVPTLGSEDLQPDPTSGTYKLAEAVASELHARLDIDSFYQTAVRDKLHLGGRTRTRDEREKIIRAVLRQRGIVAGRKYLVVDDVFTTGATMSIYAELIETAGSHLAGGVALLRYENNLPLKNPKLFVEAALRID